MYSVGEEHILLYIFCIICYLQALRGRLLICSRGYESSSSLLRAWFATLDFECSIYIHSLLFPARLTSWTFSSSTVFSLKFHVDKLALSQFFTNDRWVAPKCWLSLSTFSLWSVITFNSNNRSFYMLISKLKFMIT